MKWVCILVARRAALLSGVAVAAVLLQTDRASFADAQTNGAHDNSDEHFKVGADGRCVSHPSTVLPVF